MGELQTIRVPDIGDFDEVDVVEVIVAPGDTVAEGDSLITLESDKASLDVPSPADGEVRELLVGVGDKVGEGSPICTLDTGGVPVSAPDPSASAKEATDSVETLADEPPPPAPSESPSPAPEEPPPSADAAAAPAEPTAAAPSPAEASEGAALPLASPSVRRLARELGLDLRQVTGSSRKGRILADDLKAHVKRALASPASVAAGGASLPAPPEVDFTRFGEVEVVPLDRIKRLTGGAMRTSWLNVPHVTQHDLADITELEAFRKANKARAEAAAGKLSVLPFLVQACAAMLRRFPEFNASLAASGDDLVLKRYVNIGIAVDTPGGLVVPVVRDADRKGLLELAAELVELSGRAREGKARLDDFVGGTFTISSLGGIGGTAFTPIVNTPEVAILGVSRARMQPEWDGREFVPRLMLPLSLSYDHRVIDGAAAARFTTALATALADPRELLL